MYWLYQNKKISSLEDIQQNPFGFIYITTHTPTGKESDWKTYYGSEEFIKQKLKEGKQEEFTREIIHFVSNKKLLTYFECKYQFIYGVLENEEWINNNILGKFFTKDFDI